MLSIDFEKAFDSISHEFIYKVLDNFNLGLSIKRWIQFFFYKDAASSVLVNGFISESFIIERGCRQGDGLNPYLFLLCAEILSMMVCNDQNVQGIGIGDVEFRISQFADDTVLFLNGTRYRKVDMSGLRVYLDETNAVWIGSKKGSIEKLCKDINVNLIGPSDTY